jgi:MFS family permease
MFIFMLTSDHKKHTNNKVFYGWYIVSAGFSIQLLIGSLMIHSFTAYFPLLEAQFGWSRATLSGAFALSRAESGLLGPLQGWLIEKYGPRMMAVFGMCLFGIGFILFSQIDSILGYYVTFFLMAAGSSIAGHLTVATAIINWFNRKRGLAVGLSSTGFGLAGILVPLIAWSLTTQGWRDTAFYSGVGIIIVGIPISLILRRDPEPYGYLPDGDKLSDIGTMDKQDQDLTGFTVREAIKTSSFWYLGIGHALSLLTVGAVSLHLVPHVVDSVGLSVTIASTAVAVMTVFFVTGQIVGGFLGDKYSKRWLAAIGTLMHAVALLILAYSTNIIMVYIFSILHGSAWGLRGPIMATIRADYFGRAYFPSIMGFSSLVIMLGMTVGPLFAGYMADVFGDYKLGFIIISALAALGSIFFVLAKPPALPERQSQT